MNFAVITPSAVEPVSLSLVKESTHISHDVEDTILNSWIKSGRELAEIYLRRALINQTVEMSFDDFPEAPVILLRSPVSAITSITYYDTASAATVIDSANYLLDSSGSPARLYLKYGYDWPSATLREYDSVKIRYVAGYGAAGSSVPQCIIDAIILYCTYRNENRAGENDVPPAFYNLLNSKRLHIDKEYTNA